MTLDIKSSGDGVTFSVRISPRASRSAINGTHAGALKVSIAAPPVDGEANTALCSFLAAALGVPKRNVTIVQGEHSKSKVIAVVGVTEASVRELIAV